MHIYSTRSYFWYYSQVLRKNTGVYFFYLDLYTSASRTGIMSSMSFNPSKYLEQYLGCRSHISLIIFFVFQLFFLWLFFYLISIDSSALSLAISNLPIFTSFPQIRPSLEAADHHINLSRQFPQFSCPTVFSSHISGKP